MEAPSELSAGPVISSERVTFDCPSTLAGGCGGLPDFDGNGLVGAYDLPRQLGAVLVSTNMSEPY